ncbi:MAG: hypothetical protein JO091_02590 [Acidobacteriaceae bacterium]|nr:hypothetical protein [Acidobacteriaceae bacterium]
MRNAAEQAKQVDAIDAQAKDIIAAFRKQIANGSSSPSSPLPPVPQQLRALKVQRDQLLLSQVDQLKEQLGPQASQRLKTTIRGSFTAHISVAPVVNTTQQRAKGRDLTLPPLAASAAHQ